MWIKLWSELLSGAHSWKSRDLYWHHCHFKENPKGEPSLWYCSSQHNEIYWNCKSISQLILASLPTRKEKEGAQLFMRVSVHFWRCTWECLTWSAHETKVCHWIFHVEKMVPVDIHQCLLHVCGCEHSEAVGSAFQQWQLQHEWQAKSGQLHGFLPVWHAGEIA